MTKPPRRTLADLPDVLIVSLIGATDWLRAQWSTLRIYFGNDA